MTTVTETNTKGRSRVWLKALCFPLVLGWLLVAFWLFFPGVGRDVVRQAGADTVFWLQRLGVFDSALVLWLFALAAGMGAALLRRFGFVLRSRSERVFWGAVTGLAGFSLFMLLLGALGLYYRATAFALLIVTTLAIWWIRRRTGSTKPHADQSLARTRPGALWWLGIAYIVVVLGIIWLSAISPETDWDPLLVHLYAPERYIDAHRIVPLPEIPQTFFPRHITMLFTLGMLLNGEITAKLIHFALGLLCILGAYVVAKELAGRKAGLLAACVLVASPLFVWEMRTAHLELGLALFVFAAVVAAVRWLREREARWFWLAAACLAFAQGTKYQALLALPTLPLAVFLSEIRPSGLRRALRAAFLLGAIGAAGLLPWAMVNAVHAGNPVFPFLNDVFKSPYWTPSNTEMGVREMRAVGIPIDQDNFWEIPLVYWAMMTDPAKFRGNIGPIFALFIPLLALSWRTGNRAALKLILLFSLGYSVLWMFTGQHARYMLPLVPGLAVLAAYSLFSWVSRGADGLLTRLLNAATLIIAGGALILSMPFFEEHAGSKYGCTLRRSISVDYLFKRQSQNDYRTAIVSSNAAAVRLTELPGNKKVLFWWNTGPCLFVAKCEALCYYSPWFSEFVSSDPEALRDRLLAHGITHVIAGQENQEGHLITRPEGEFVRRYLKKIFQKNATILYQFSPEPLDQEVVYFDFLNHMEDARISMPRYGPHPNADYKKSLGVKGDRRLVLFTLSPARVEYRVKVPEKARMTFSVGQFFFSCSDFGVLTVELIPAGGQPATVYRRELYAEGRPGDEYWQPAEVDLTEYANQEVTIAFASARPGGFNCAYYLFADPVLSCPRASLGD